MEATSTSPPEVAFDETAVEGVEPERVVLVGVARKKPSSFADDEDYTLHESLEELHGLAETAGLVVVEQFYQYVDKPSPATYIGSGKLKEIGESVAKQKASTVIFDEELSPVQLTNIEKSLGFVCPLALAHCPKRATFLAKE